MKKLPISYCFFLNNMIYCILSTQLLKKEGIKIMATEKSLKVLIVDDDKNICDLLRLYLEKDGYSVILSHDGEEAVVKFNALKPDMVLLDI